jgi:ankyrin repeat protein
MRGETALIDAAASGKTDVVKLLLDKGANINAKDAGGHTTLWWAIHNGDTEVARLLQARGAH